MLGAFSTDLLLVVQPVAEKFNQDSHYQRSQYQLHDALEQAIFTSLLRRQYNNPPCNFAVVGGLKILHCEVVYDKIQISRDAGRPLRLEYNGYVCMASAGDGA